MIYGHFILYYHKEKKCTVKCVLRWRHILEGYTKRNRWRSRGCLRVSKYTLTVLWITLAFIFIIINDNLSFIIDPVYTVSFVCPICCCLFCLSCLLLTSAFRLAFSLSLYFCLNEYFVFLLCFIYFICLITLVQLLWNVPRPPENKPHNWRWRMRCESEMSLDVTWPGGQFLWSERIQTHHHAPCIAFFIDLLLIFQIHNNNNLFIEIDNQ